MSIQDINLKAKCVKCRTKVHYRVCVPVPGRKKPYYSTWCRQVDAQRDEVDKKAEFRQGGPVTDAKAGKITLRAYAEEFAARQLWESSTLSSHREAINGLGVIADYPLHSITKIQGELFVATAVQSYAGSTVTQRMKKIRTVLNGAVRDKRIPCNPWVGIKTPKREKPEFSAIAPTTKELNKLLQNASPRLKVLIHLAAHAGLRIGECVAIRRQQVLTETGELLVDLQCHKGELRPPKHKSKRTFRISSALTEILVAHMATVDGEYLFPGRWKTKPIRENTVEVEWRRLCDSVGVDLPYRSLRHYYATSNLSNGVDVATVSQAMGHHSPAITHEYYSHAIPDNRDVLRRSGDELMRRAEIGDDDH